jgi:hypothetical protein
MGQADRLPAVGVAGHLGDDLGGDIAGRGKAVRLFDQGIRDHRAVLEHVFQIHQLTVADRPGHISHIVDMDDAFIVGFDHILRKDVSPADILGDFTRQVIPHRAVDDRVLIGVLLLGQLIVMPEQRQDLGIRAVLLSEQFMPQPVIAIVERKPVMPRLLQFIDHHVLDFFDAHTSAKRFTALFNLPDNKTDLRIGKPVLDGHLLIGGFNGVL